VRAQGNAAIDAALAANRCPPTTGSAAGVSTAAQTPNAPAATQHRVAAGESLSTIAQRYYGDPRQWVRLFLANRAALSNPNRIFPGQVLNIP
jgi:nucleoid-associated protein YgaU